MSKRFRVLDCASTEGEQFEHFCTATTTENAATALGAELERAGRSERLRAKVYSQSSDDTVTMVRLYTQTARQS